MLNLWVALVLVGTLAPVATLLLREAVLFAVYLSAVFNRKWQDMKYIGVATTLVFALVALVGYAVGRLT